MRIKIFNSKIEIFFRVFVIHELHYSGGKDFKKAVANGDITFNPMQAVTFQKVARKKRCEYGLYLYTKEFLNAPLSMSNKEKIRNGWMLTWPFTVDEDDNESIIMVTLDGKDIETSFEIAPGEYVRLVKNDKEYVVRDRLWK